MEEDRFEHIESGIDRISKLLKLIKKPADANSKKELTESLALLKNKLKMMKKDESLAIQYLDRVKFDVIQGIFQALHLYIISVDDTDELITTAEWLRSHENCYSIAARMQKAALNRAEFSGAKK